MKQEIFFVGIDDSISLRREALQSSQRILGSLKKYEAYRKLNMMKRQHMLEFKRVFDELLVLNKKIRSKLPKSAMKMAPVEIRERKVHRKKKKVNSKAAQIDMLEAELAKVEERLAGLQN